MMRRTCLLALLLAAGLLSGCGLLEAKPEGERIVPPRFPVPTAEGMAVSDAETFTAWVKENGSQEQRTAVVGHIGMITGTWENPHDLGMLITDHTDENTARTVADTFATWGDHADHDIRTAVYGKGGDLLYTREPE
ncbi:hypothetical protein ACWF94_26010 [Streptomyces sp. NPDC055078]